MGRGGGENDSKTLRVGAYFLCKNGDKFLHFPKTSRYVWTVRKTSVYVAQKRRLTCERKAEFGPKKPPFSKNIIRIPVDKASLTSILATDKVGVKRWLKIQEQ